MSWQGKSLPAELFPERELKCWKSLTGPSAMLAAESLAAEWRKDTIELNWSGYASYAGWLHSWGEFHPLVTLEQRITSERVVAFISDMRKRGNSAATIYLRVLGLERVLAVLAAHADRSFLRTILKNLPKGGDFAKKRGRLQESTVLFALGIQLMQHVESSSRLFTRQFATLFRDGLQIALLALRPLRCKNFAEMELDKNLVLRGDEWWLYFDPEETKNGFVIDVHLPQSLLPWLEKYLSIYRPILAGSTYSGKRVWTSYRFMAQSNYGIYDPNHEADRGGIRAGV